MPFDVHQVFVSMPTGLCPCFMLRLIMPFSYLQDGGSARLTGTAMVGPPIGAPRTGVPPPPHTC